MITYSLHSNTTSGLWAQLIGHDNGKNPNVADVAVVASFCSRIEFLSFGPKFYFVSNPKTLGSHFQLRTRHSIECDFCCCKWFAINFLKFFWQLYFIADKCLFLFNLMSSIFIIFCWQLALTAVQLHRMMIQDFDAVNQKWIGDSAIFQLI